MVRVGWVCLPEGTPLMAEPQIKSRLESPELTTNQTEPVRQRLNACLASDPQHIAPGQRGNHVKAVQDALETLRQRMPNLGLVKITDPPGTYGQSTAAEVKKYKRINHIVRTGQPLDDIVGRMTISQIDNDLLRGSNPTPPPPSPPPEPPPPPPPIVGVAGVQIGPQDNRGRFIADYYTKCGLETIGPGQITTGGIQHFSTLEDLIDVLQGRPEVHQVIVNHGNPDSGLLLPLVKESSYNRTGLLVGPLSNLADLAAKGEIDPTGPDADMYQDVAKTLHVQMPVVVRLLRKIVAVRKTKRILHFRACNLQSAGMLQDYKAFFAAVTITYHSCRLLFIPFKPDQVKPGRSVAEFNSDKNTAKARLRTFDDPIGLLSPLLLAIVDVDGHTHVQHESFLDHRSPEQVLGWANFLLRQWRESAPTGFVVPIMWDNSELTFYCPLEVGWRQKLKYV